MKEKLFLLTVLLLLFIFQITFAAEVSVVPSELNASRVTFLNFTIKNTDASNISKVTILVPPEFKNVANIGTSVDRSIVNMPSQSNPLIWSNRTAEGLISANATEYFWFSVLTPSVPSRTYFTFSVNLTYVDGSESEFMVEVSVNDIDSPQYFEISFLRPNNTKYSPGMSYGFQIRWKDNVNVSDVMFYSNFNESKSILVPLMIGSKSDGIYVINFTDLSAGVYWFMWHANDTSGNFNETSNITYVIEKADNLIKVFLNGEETNYIKIENGTTINITVIAVGNICLFKEGESIKCEEKRLEWNERLEIGDHRFEVNVSSNNANYSSNATGLNFSIKVIYPRIRFMNLQAPSSATYSPGATYTFKITFLSPAYPLNNISNVSFTFNNQVYYLPVNRQDNETYEFVLRDLPAGNYNWKFCANDTQKEMSCSSGVLYISQAIPRLDILNVQDYLAPVNKTIVGVGCPEQLVCKLYLNHTELPSRYYDLVTDKPGYYIFTFNTSGNANYSAASVTKTMTIYPPKGVTTTTVPPTTTTIQQEKKLSEESVLSAKAGVPTLYKVDNSDLLKVTEVELVTSVDINNIEIKVEIPLPNEIKIFSEKNKVPLAYIKITSNVSAEKIVNIKIRFKVEKARVNINNIDENKVALYKLENDKWLKIPTTKIGDDESNIYYESLLSSFSIFAIVGEVKAGFPWHLALIPVVITIVAIIVYLFWPTPLGNEYERLKQKWSSRGT